MQKNTARQLLIQLIEHIVFIGDIILALNKST